MQQKIGIKFPYYNDENIYRLYFNSLNFKHSFLLFKKKNLTVYLYKSVYFKL